MAGVEEVIHYVEYQVAALFRAWRATNARVWILMVLRVVAFITLSLTIEETDMTLRTDFT